MVEYYDFDFKSGLGIRPSIEGEVIYFQSMPNVLLTEEQLCEITRVGRIYKYVTFRHKETGAYYGLSITEDEEMPKPTNEQIVDAVKDEHKKNAHLGIEFAIQSVMDQYDISGVDVAVAFVTAPAMKVAATEDVVEAEDTKKKK